MKKWQWRPYAAFGLIAVWALFTVNLLFGQPVAAFWGAFSAVLTVGTLMIWRGDV